MKCKTNPIADNVSAHITPVGGSVFADLGFCPVKAKALQAQVREVIAKKLADKPADMCASNSGINNGFLT